MIASSNLVKVCTILNKHGVTYAITGGYACALNGHIRMTGDIDILLLNEDNNLRKTITALKEIFPHIREQIQIEDIKDNIVLKIIDDIEIDISIKAWTLEYSDATQDLQHVTIDNTLIPYLGINSLIKSKTTYREIDQWDIKILKEIQKQSK